MWIPCLNIFWLIEETSLRIAQLLKAMEDHELRCNECLTKVDDEMRILKI